MLVAAHGNSLRAMVKHLDDMSDDAVVELNIPTGMPLVYELDEYFAPTRSRSARGEGPPYLDPGASGRRPPRTVKRKAG